MGEISAVRDDFGLGSVGHLFSYTVNEDSTPLNPADSSGSVGAVTLSAKATADADYMAGRSFTLTDPKRGAVRSVARTVAGAGGRNTFTAESLLGLLNTDRTVPPHVGTLASAFTAYIQTCYLAGPSSISVAAQYLSYPVAYGGWKGNVWEHLKMLCAATGAEVALVDGVITLRAPGARTANLTTLASVGTSVSVNGAAQNVEIWSQNTREVIDEVVFVADSAYNVGVREKSVFRLQLDASLDGVNNPTPRDVPYNSAVSGAYNGGYMVSGSDGLPISASWWVGNGGGIACALTENPYEIEVTISGPDLPYAASLTLEPISAFRIAWGEDAYPMLHITGRGVLSERELLTFKTGASEKTTSVLVGATIDNPFIQNTKEACTAGLRAACAFAGPKKTLTFSQKHLDASGQEFGNIGGAMIDFGDSRYRVRSASIDAANIGGSAESRVTFADLSAARPGATFLDFNLTFNNQTFGEQAIAPLKKTYVA